MAPTTDGRRLPRAVREWGTETAPCGSWWNSSVVWVGAVPEKNLKGCMAFFRPLHPRTRTNNCETHPTVFCSFTSRQTVTPLCGGMACTRSPLLLVPSLHRYVAAPLLSATWPAVSHAPDETNSPTVAIGLSLARLMGQYCFACWSLSSSVTSTTARAVGPPTLHGRPVVLRPVRATPC